MTKTVLIQYLSETDTTFKIPEYQTSGSAGMDIRACLPKSERSPGWIILPGDRLLISSGFKIQIPVGFEGQIRARSGLALKHGITLANGVGTIDSDYRGDLGILLINLGSEAFKVKHGQRIAQLIISTYSRVELKRVKDLSITDRGSFGYGSTGDF